MASGNNPLHKKIKDLNAQIDHERQDAAGWKDLYSQDALIIQRLSSELTEIKSSLVVKVLASFGVGALLGALVIALF